jgi:glycosyltransferase involved in cell wall biosynthesis
MRLLHVIASIDPRGGGPLEVVRLTSQALAEAGHAAEIVTLDAPDAAAVAALPARVHALGPSRGRYAWNASLRPWLVDHLPRFDAALVHGLWQYCGAATRRAAARTATPYFVFAHGMLDPWFNRAYPLKHAKKLVYWRCMETGVLRDAAAVLYTCEEERRLATNAFRPYRAREAIVPLGTAVPAFDFAAARARFLGAYPALADRRLLLFLGRLNPKKGCDLLIEAYARVARDHPEHALVFAGPDEVGWRADLERLAAAAGLASRIAWTGMLAGELKWGALHASEALVLPSHQENFGFVVAEALACGTPALLSTQVNIWREVTADGAGFADADTVDGTERTLRRWLAAGPGDRARMAVAARGCFTRRFTTRAMTTRLLEVLGVADAAGGGGRPPTVIAR